jgi:nitrogenase molybdenum-iron protein alpha/beta subunit
VSGLKGEAEVEFAGNVIWVNPWHPYWFRTSYFMQALTRVLHQLGAQRPAPRIRRYARVRWAQVPWYRKRLHG